MLMLLLASIIAQAAFQADDAPGPTRLVVLTDISSLTSGVAEPDDGQSLIRLMLYANEFDIEGLVATSNLIHGQATHPELIRRVVEAYGRVQPNLARHDPRYPRAEIQLDRIAAGQPHAGPKLAVEESVGAGKDTEGSRLIVRVVDRPDPRPVWILIWGGSADLAQALWSVRTSRTPEGFARFLERLRVSMIGDQDSTGPWIREQFPTLFMITHRRAYRGMYRGGDVSLAGSTWVKTHIHGHGALGELYPDYNGGDIWSNRLGRVRGIKEGDTPSFLALVPNGLGLPRRGSALATWGGRFGQATDGPYLTDLADGDIDTRSDPDPRMSSVHRWRDAFQADFQARLDWCVRSPGEANHPPRVRVAGPAERASRPGDLVTLDASATADPDGDCLEYRWSIDPNGSWPVIGDVSIDHAGQPVARLNIPMGATEGTILMLLSVSDQGQPRLTRYARIAVHVKRAR